MVPRAPPRMRHGTARHSCTCVHPSAPMDGGTGESAGAEADKKMYAKSLPETLTNAIFAIILGMFYAHAYEGKVRARVYREKDKNTLITYRPMLHA